LLTYQSRQLAKLPREAPVRAEELKATTRVTVDELRRLSVPQTTPLRMANPVPPAGTEEPRRVGITSIGIASVQFWTGCQ
jgi:hypothetical protein